jgi:hypothetical protein
MELRKTKIKGLYITCEGKAWHKSAKREITPTQSGKIRFNGKMYVFTKIIGYEGKKAPKKRKRKQKQPIKKTVILKPGSKKEFNTTKIQPAPTKKDLVKCLRLYFEISEKFTPSNILFKYFLNEIAFKRGFVFEHQKHKDFDLFLQWMQPKCIFSTQNKIYLSKANGYTIAHGTNAINYFLGLLVKDCLQDLENGILKIKDFAPKPPTKTDTLRALQKKATEYGFNIKIPLRKKSQRELLAKYIKAYKVQKAKDLKISQLQNEPPK